MDYRLVVAVVKRGRADAALDAAKEAGAEGATVFFARGTSIHGPVPFMGLRITSEQEVVLMLVEAPQADAVLEAVVAAAEIEKPGMGIAFAMPIDRVLGIVHAQDQPPSEPAGS